MICPKCKAEITDGAIFCSKCGKKVKNVEKSEEKKTIVSIAAILAVTILLVVVVAALLYFYSPIRIWTNLMESEALTDAVEYLAENQSSMSEQDIDAVINITKLKADSIYSKYQNEEIEYEDAINQIDELGKMSVVSEEMNSYSEMVKKVYASRQEFESGEKAFSEEKYDEAIMHYVNVVEEDLTHYRSAQDSITKSVDSYRDSILKFTEDFKTRKDYKAALALIDKGLKVLNDDDDLLKAKEDVSVLEEEQNTQELLSTVEEFRKNGETDRALKNINKYNGNDEKVIALKVQIESEYEIYIDNSVKELIKAKDVNGAKKLINEAKSLCPSSEVIKEWNSSIDDYFPVSLLDMNQFIAEKDYGNFYCKDNWVAGKDHDNLGNTDYVGLVYQVAYNKTTGGTFTYLIDGKYDTLSGMWAIKDVSKDKIEEKNRATISVYGDGACLYTSPVIRGGVKPIEFEVDISGVNELVLRIDATGSLYFALLNPELYKSIE